MQLIFASLVFYIPDVLQGKFKKLTQALDAYILDGISELEEMPMCDLLEQSFYTIFKELKTYDQIFGQTYT